MHEIIPSALKMGPSKQARAVQWKGKQNQMDSIVTGIALPWLV